MEAPVVNPPPVRKSAPYLFLGQTTSLCEHCDALVPAKIIEQDGAIYYSKRCPEHGVQKTLISSDPAYYRRCREFLKPGDRPLVPQTVTEKGCPWDCGLCPDHEQHSCVALVEINQHCNLECPVCFAASSPHKDSTRSLAQIEQMFDALVESEGEPDVVQISGGEPTLHPDILEIIRTARERPIKHLMLNTNGVRISRDEVFVEALAEFKPGFEVYLQFDALDDEGLQAIRGADLARTRIRALEALEKHGVSTTLVVTVKRGVNDHALGDIVDFARKWRCVRGINFQPIQDAGRNPDYDKQKDRVVLSDIRRAIIDADNPFTDGDIIPLPCNPDYIAVGYALRQGDQLTPLTSLITPEEFTGLTSSGITFEHDEKLRERFFELFSLASSPENLPQRRHKAHSAP